MGREQAPDPRAVVCVEQDEYLGAQVEEVDKGQRLPEVDLFSKRVRVLQSTSDGILPLLREATEVEPDVLDSVCLSRKSRMASSGSPVLRVPTSGS